MYLWPKSAIHNDIDEAFLPTSTFVEELEIY